MDTVYQVFVSSTYDDLKDERRLVNDTLAKAGLVPAGMELFPATDQQQLEFIKRIIDRSDYYVVVVGGRYGSLADGEVSFTEREYEYALQRQLPVLAFLPKDFGKIAAEKTDTDPKQQARLTAFCDRLRESRLIDTWTTPADLCTKVLTAVVNAINLSPGVGWVRGDQAINPKILQDAERMRAEIAALQQRVKDFESEGILFPSGIAGPDTSVEIDVDLTDIRDGRPAAKVLHAKIAIGELFIELFDEILKNPSDKKLEGIVGHLLAFRSDDFAKASTASVRRSDITKLRFHLEALGLIRGVGVKSATAGTFITWSVTDKGRQYAVLSRAIPAKTPPGAN